MGEAVRRALTLLRERKAIYKQNSLDYFRPWMFLITDGHPTDEWESAARQVKEEEARKGVSFYGVGVEGADMQTLASFSDRNYSGSRRIAKSGGYSGSRRIAKSGGCWGTIPPIWALPGLALAIQAERLSSYLRSKTTAQAEGPGLPGIIRVAVQEPVGCGPFQTGRTGSPGTRRLGGSGYVALEHGE